MHILQPFEEKIRLQIRNELALKPVITMTALNDRMKEVFGRGFDYEYLRKLVGKVRNEISYEIDTAKIAPRLAFTRENYRMMREELLKIVYWKPGDEVPKPLARDKVEAAKNVVMLDLAILNAEAAAGMYKKPIEELAREVRYEPLAPEVRAVVLRSWRNFGLLPAAVIEQMVPEMKTPALQPEFHAP